MGLIKSMAKFQNQMFNYTPLAHTSDMFIRSIFPAETGYNAAVEC